MQTMMIHGVTSLRIENAEDKPPASEYGTAYASRTIRVESALGTFELTVFGKDAESLKSGGEL